MTTQDRIMKARVGIILSQPFFATLMLRKNFIEDTSIKTTQTNGDDIMYNPEFIDKQTHDELQTIICHDLMHGVSLHHLRREGRDPEMWNRACDYSINPLLVNAGFKLPKDALIDKSRFANHSAEQIYGVLLKEKKDDKGNNDQQQGQGQPGGSQPQQGQPQPGDQPGQPGKPQPPPDPGNMGGVQDAPAKSEAEKAEAEAKTKMEVAQAIQAAKKAGNLPAGVERVAKAILQPRIDWQEVLARFLDEVCKNDYSFSRPNTRYMHSGFVLPSLYNIERGKVVLIVDTSGSIDNKLLNQFASEMQEVCSTSNSPIHVLYVNNRFQREQIIEPDDVFELKAKGSGGTNFKPGFEHIEKEGIDPRCIVYFTDMECHAFPDKEPDCPVLWAQYGSYENEPPFGELIHIDQ